MAKRAIACALAWQLGMPVAPVSAGEPAMSRAASYWVQVALLSVDVQQRRVTYGLATGDQRTATVASDTALRRLTEFTQGEQVELKCTEHVAGDILVFEAKKAKGRSWWKWVLLVVGAFMVLSVVAAVLSGESCGDYCG